MAKPKPGSKSYSGPVGEGWGRPIQTHIRNADKLARDVDRNFRSGVGAVESGLRGGIQSGADAISNFFNPPAKAKVNTTYNRAAGYRAVAKGRKAGAQAAAKRSSSSSTRVKSSSPALKAKAKSSAKLTKTGGNKRTRAVSKAAAKVTARTGVTGKAARAKARKIVKKRK